jgi:hypothetical protein
MTDAKGPVVSERAGGTSAFYRHHHFEHVVRLTRRCLALVGTVEEAAA